jgi:hypothetical protein
MKRITLAALLLVSILSLVFVTGCRERTIYTNLEGEEWLLLDEDDDEGTVAYNGFGFFVNAFHLAETPPSLTFKMETHASIPDPANDVIMAIYLDTDQNATTGYTGFSGQLVPNDIGAEYMLLVGTEPDAGNTNELDSWNETDGSWETVGPVTVNAQADSLIVTAGFSSIGDPSSVDVVAIMICNPGTSELRDFIPENGHATVSVLATQVAVVQTCNPTVIQESKLHNKHISVITGKVVD